MPTRLPRQHQAEIEAALGRAFREPALLEEALTHASSVRPAAAGAGAGAGAGAAGGGEPPPARRSYQRLEFLGDRVLGLVIAHLLIERFPDDGEGALTHRLGELVKKDALVRIAAEIGLGRWLQVAAREFGQAGSPKPAMLADCCEALIGALYLDGGLEPARAFVARHWRPLVEAVELAPRDAKMALQEWAQGRGLERPVYEVVATAGPPHATVFTVEVSLTDRAPVSGAGSTKRAAERAAAERMLAGVEGTADD